MQRVSVHHQHDFRLMASKNLMGEFAQELRTMYFVYIVCCSDGSLYTGYTVDLDKRLAAHNCGCGARYTRSRRPVKLVYSECFTDKSQALSREARIKQLNRAEKCRLIATGNRPD